ncbi:hypothetical protein [Terriglobus aquaticus]
MGITKKAGFYAGMALAFAATLAGQSERHGRKYKAPPETSHLEVLVLRDTSGKVIENAGVVFHPTKDGNDEGNLEVKSGVDGKAFIDIIPTGSVVQVQVIASGFATYSGTITLDSPSKQLTIRMKRPQEQYSTYAERSGVSTQKSGVQEPTHRTIAPTQNKAITATDPVLKLPGAPADPKQGGDPTVSPKADHNVSVPASTTPPPQPNRSSAPMGNQGATTGTTTGPN